MSPSLSLPRNPGATVTSWVRLRVDCFQVVGRDRRGLRACEELTHLRELGGPDLRQIRGFPRVLGNIVKRLLAMLHNELPVTLANGRPIGRLAAASKLLEANVVHL